MGHKTENHHKEEPNDIEYTEDYEVNSTPKKNKFINMFNLAMFPFVLLGAFFLVRLLLSRDPRSFCPCIKDEIDRYYPSKWGFEQKLEVIFLTWALSGFVVLLSAFGVMFFRMITLRTPLDSCSEPVLLTTFNRIMLNTIAQTFIFLGLFGFWVLRQGDSEHALRYLTIFAVARVLFFVGYIIQGIFGLMPLRAIGFAMTLMVNLIVLLEILGHNSREKILNAGEYDFVNHILVNHLNIKL